MAYIWVNEEKVILKKSRGKLDEKICRAIFNTYFCDTFIVLAFPFGMTIELAQQKKKRGFFFLKKSDRILFPLLVFP
jgi:hypothetical protein